MHSEHEVQPAAVTIIRYIQHYGSYYGSSSPLEFISPWYSATSIILTLFVPTLDYLDQLENITTHAQKARPMIFCRCGHGLSNEWRTLQTCLGKTCLLDHFSEHCWQWLYCIGIIYRLDIINHVKNIGTSVIRTFRIIEVALYSSTQDMVRMLIVYSIGTVVASLLFLVCGLSLILVWITLIPKFLIESAKYLGGLKSLDSILYV